MKDKKTVADIVCPKCKSENWYLYSTDEQDFCDEGIGYCIADIHCEDCGANSRVKFEFEYNIINIKTR